MRAWGELVARGWRLTGEVGLEPEVPVPDSPASVRPATGTVEFDASTARLLHSALVVAAGDGGWTDEERARIEELARFFAGAAGELAG